MNLTENGIGGKESGGDDVLLSESEFMMSNQLLFRLILDFFSKEVFLYTLELEVRF